MKNKNTNSLGATPSHGEEKSVKSVKMAETNLPSFSSNTILMHGVLSSLKSDAEEDIFRALASIK